MLIRPFRKTKYFIAVILILIVIFVILLVRNGTFSKKEQEIHPKHIFRGHQEEYIDSNGIKVVVGHYVGNPVPKIPNATDEMINKNYFNPVPSAGKNGNPVVIEQKFETLKRQFFQINKFNLMASDRIPLNRSLPDVRRKKCSMIFKDYKQYPKTSVIIVFHNEAWSTLFRTVWSVINRSPRELVEEIILVDDASERDFLKQPLDEYSASLPIPTKVVRSKERIGLIKARLKGAALARGEVLTFLDAHCECTKGWLEPLLSVIKSDRRTFVCPIIDIINDETFAYVKSFELHWGAFNWNLQFRWYTLVGKQLNKRKMDATQPFDTPAMAGGLFAVDRKFFYEIGSYDEGMNIWGGENLELSFRAWQCGGKIQIAPCSHVGHLFRKSSPYSFPGGINKTLFANLARLALVWMDDWGNFYFKFNEQARKIKDSQNVTSRVELRKRLKCRSFEWYLDNIWPENSFPRSDRFFGRIQNAGADGCLTKPLKHNMFSNQPSGTAILEPCFKERLVIQMFVMAPEGYIMTDDNICLDAPEKSTATNAKVRIMPCSRQTRQLWEYNKETKEIRHKTNQKCLDMTDSSKLNDGLIINDCDNSGTQKWILETINWK